MKEENQQFPKNWEECPISNVFEIRSGYGFPKDLQGNGNGDIPFFKVGDISKNWQSGEITLVKANHYISEETSDSLRIKKFPKGSVVFAKIGAAVALNRRAILDQDSAIDNNVMSLIPNTVTEPKYTFYFMCQVDLGKNTRGGNVPSLRNSDVGDLPFPLPPLNEQKRIVAKIEELFSELDAGEQSLRDARQQLTLYRQSLLKQAFEGKLTEQWRANNPHKLEAPEKLLARIQQERESRHQQQLQDWQQAVDQWEQNGKEGKKPAKPRKIVTPESVEQPWSIPSSWCWTSMGHLKLFSLYGPRFSSDDYSNNGISVLRTSDISETGKVNLASTPKLQLSESELYQYRCDKGDLLITRTGSLGTLAQFNDNIDAIPGAYLIQYRLSNPLYSTYLYHFFKSPIGQAKLTGGGAGVGRPNLNAPTIELIAIPLCSLSEQQEIDRILDEQFTAIEHNEKEIDLALTQSQALRQSILKKAFKGKL